MESLKFMKIAAGVACLVVAFGAQAQGTGIGSSMGSANTSMGQKVSDSTVTTKVKAALLSASGLKSTNIHVRTVDGVVRLTGTVPDHTQKDQAEQVTQGVSGVQSVDNQLKTAS